MTQRYPFPLRYLFQAEEGKYAALNTGIHSALGSIIAATDDDARFEVDWLERAADGLRRYDCDFVGGPVRPLWGGPKPVWLRTWALVGIRNEFQATLSAREACEANFRYLTTHTNYLTKRQLRDQFGQYYTDVRFVEGAFLQNRPRGGALARLTKRLPLLPDVYSAVGNRVAFGRRAAVRAPDTA